MAVAGWRLMAVIVSVTVTTCMHQPETHTRTKLVWIFAMYGATPPQTTKYAVCPSAWLCTVQCSAAVSKYRIKY